MYHYWRKHIRCDYEYMHSYDYRNNRDKTIKRLVETIACVPTEPTIIQMNCIHRCIIPDIRTETMRFYKKRLSLLLVERSLDNPSLLTTLRYREYDEFYNLYVRHYKFIRLVKPLLREIYKRNPYLEPIYEEIYHPDRVNELHNSGMKFSEIATVLDNRIDSVI